jgi:hypothetical protein
MSKKIPILPPLFVCFKFKEHLQEHYKKSPLYPPLVHQLLVFCHILPFL